MAETNESRKAQGLLKKAEKAHAWRTQVFAQCELRIRAINAELAVLGQEEYEPWKPDFDDDDTLRHYAEMPLG